MPTIDDLIKNGVNHYGYYQPEQKPEEDGNFTRGFKRAMVQIPETLGGTAALVGDLVGSEGLRDYGMGIYEKNHARSEELTRDSDSFSNVMEGNAGMGDFLAGGAGYVAGQALGAVATGGVGGFIGRQLAMRGIKNVAERAVESQMAKAVASKVAAQGTKVGAGAALFDSNLSQEAGSIYPEAIEQARQDGRELDGGDKARVVGSALAAAGTDTAMDAIMLGRVLKGGRKAGEGVVKAAAREVPGAMAREAVTEGIQTGIERFGAGQDLSTADAIRDYVDSMAVGALGGGMGGAAAVLHAQKVPESGPLTRAANAGLDQKILQLTNDPNPLIAFPDGSVGHKADFEAYISSLPEEQRIPARAKLMGAGEQPADKPKEEPTSSSPEVSAANIAAWSSKHDPVTLEYAQQLIQTPGAKGQNLMVVPHGSGKGFTVLPSKWISIDDQAKAMALQKRDSSQLPGPDTRLPDGDLIAGPDGIRAETYGDRQVADAARQRRKELGTPAPKGEPYQGALDDRNGAATQATDAAVSGTDAVRGAGDVRRNSTAAGEQAATSGSAGTAVQDHADANGPQSADAVILNPKGKPFLSKFAAQKKLRDDMLTETHDVVPTDDGFVIKPKATAAIDQAAHEAATSPKNGLPEPTQAQKEAGNYKVGRIKLHGLDISIENPEGSTRSGVDKDGKAWSNTMQSHYGYIRRTEGADGDHVDTFIGQNPDSDRVFIVDQVDPATGKFDEHKVMLGFNSSDKAAKAYQANYAKGWKGGKQVHELSMDDFKAWLKDGDTKKPYSATEPAPAPAEATQAAQPEKAEAQAAAGPAKKAKTGAQVARDKLKRENPFLAFLANEGVSLQDRADAGMDKGRGGNRMVPGYGPVFRKSGKRMDELALRAVEEGHLSHDDIDNPEDTGGTRKLAGMINRAVAGREIILPASEVGDTAEIEARNRNDAALLSEAKALGIDTAGMTPEQVYDAVVTKHAALENERDQIEAKSVEEHDTIDAYLDSIPDELQEIIDSAFDSPISQEALTDEEIDRFFGIETEGSGSPEGDSRGQARESGQTDQTAPGGKARQEDFGLTGETADEARARINADEQRQKDEIAARKAADIKAKADAEASEFTLTGSDRPADANPNQGDIFAASTKAPALQQRDKKVAAKKPEPTVIQDAGEKIGGARKDRWKERGLNLDDLDSMSESEGAELATKANVWKPDYEAIAEKSEPVTAAMIKVVYDQLAAKPKKNTPEGRRNYVRMMQAVRKVYSEANGPEEVRNAYHKLREEIGMTNKEPDPKRALELTKAAKEVLFSVYKGRTDPFVFSYNELARAKKLVEEGFPAKGEPWKKRLVIRRDGGPGLTPKGVEYMLKNAADVGTPITEEQARAGVFRVVTKDSRTLAYLPTQADAEAAAKNIYEQQMKGNGDDKIEPSRPHLDDMKRENLPQRIDRDVSAEDFVKQFGFRGIEFGNWSAQDERQRLLNMAYDGLMDLAEIVGVPRKALSLNGTMGMAFGARGGGKASAHYEPGKLVINMTKLRGGGSLAHEWAHALDHYFGELNQADAYTTKARGASGWYDEEQYNGVPRKRTVNADGQWKTIEKLRLDNLRPEMASAFDRVMQALFQGQISKAEMIRSLELDLERYKALAAKEQDPDLKAMYERGVKSREQNLEETRQDPEDKTYPKGRSQYAAEAQKLVGKSSKGYWTRPTEMFARAFESYIFDKIKAMGGRSDYLVHGVESDRYAGGNYKGNPYPVGVERATINSAFDKLFQTLKTKEADNGNVALYFKQDQALIDQAVKDGIIPAGEPTAADPFKTKVAADLYAKKNGIEGEPVKVDGGFLFDPKPQPMTEAEQKQARADVEALNKALKAAGEGEVSPLFEAPTANHALAKAIAKVFGTEVRFVSDNPVFEGVAYRGVAYLKAGMRRPELAIAGHEVFHTLEQSNPKLAESLLEHVRSYLHEGVVEDRQARESLLAGKDVSERYAAGEVLADLNGAMWLDPQFWREMRQRDENLFRRVAYLFMEAATKAIGSLTGTRFDASALVRDVAAVRSLIAQAWAENNLGMDRKATVDGAPRFSRGEPDVKSGAAVDTIRQAVDLVRSDKAYTGLHDIVSVTPEAVEEARAHGLNIEGFTHAIDGSAIRHTLKNHGNERIELARGQIPITDADFAAIPDILARPDKTVYGMKNRIGRDVIGYIKTMSDGTTVYLEEVRTGRNRLVMQSMRKYPRTTNATSVEKSLRPTSKTLSGDDISIVDHAHENNGEEIARTQELGNAAASKGGAADTVRNQILEEGQQEGSGDSPADDQSGEGQEGLKFSRTADMADSFMGKLGVQENIRNNVSDLFQSEKTFNGWWHKTIGTQYHKAQIDKHFRRVYDAAQRYLSSVSMFANDAADLAPTLLPKLDGLRDLTKKPPSKADTEAAGRAIFEGTLNDKKVYSDAELRSKFKLNDKQIEMYREFRAATDKSLDDMGKTDMLRYAGKEVSPYADQVMAAKDVNDAAEIMAKQLEKIGDEDAAKVIRAKAERIAQLKQEGYAPLMRFGEHTVYVTGKNGEQIFFGMAETAREAAALAREMKEIYPDATVTKGVLSKEGHRLFSGISPDTIEVFANVTGLAKDPLFQDYLKLVVNNRSALTRLIHRKGIAGFSQDTTRVLASFLTSNARASSKNLHAGDMTQAANDIPKEKGDVRDEAIKLVDYIQNPVEEAAKVRGLLFTNFIGGSIASAAVNMTQPVMMTLPYLSQFGGVGKATSGLLGAMKTAASIKTENIPDKALREAMHRAENEGIVSPQEIHNLQAEAMRSSKGFSVGGKEIVPAFAARKMAILWGGFFGLAEQFNRRATFIAAYEMAKGMSKADLEKAGVADAYEFATKAIAETQGVYNRGNRPDWARGALGATLMTFKQYSVSYLEFLKRLPPKERTLALAILMVAAGANGLPFADDLDDVIDTIGQALGYNMNIKKVKERVITNALGQGAADFLLHGATGVSGVPLDVSMRMGMANLLPATGLLLKSEKDKSRQYAEVLGAAGGYSQKVVTAGGKLLEGDVPGAMTAISSTAVSNVIKAVDMMQNDSYRDAKGRKVIDTDAVDAIVKGMGFQPAEVAREQRQLGIARQDIDMANAVKAEIADKWAQGVFEKEPDAARKAREAINAWNDKNPEARINVTSAQIASRLREMRMTKEQRVIKHAPKAMRAIVRDGLE